VSQFNYPNTAATASRLLKRFGAACQVLHPGAAVYNPDTGTVEPTITTTASTAAIFAYAQKYVDGTLIKQGDQ
jgi:hypothetical protein